jgi:hypothetical protein
MEFNSDEKIDSSKDENFDGWTVQSSKPRRLAPQWTLSRQDLGADNIKSKSINIDTTTSKTRG